MSGSHGRVLALDFGSVRTGVALSDPSRSVAEPLASVTRASSSDGMATIQRIVVESGVSLVVVGLPVGPRGRTRQTQQAQSFAARLAQQLDVPVELHDERYTSKLADRSAAASGSGTSRDSLAACHILTSWMEAQNR